MNRLSKRTVEPKRAITKSHAQGACFLQSHQVDLDTGWNMHMLCSLWSMLSHANGTVLIYAATVLVEWKEFVGGKCREDWKKQ
jgi:hypothetical protein